jgi:hypothetical protein
LTLGDTPGGQIATTSWFVVNHWSHAEVDSENDPTLLIKIL